MNIVLEQPLHCCVDVLNANVLNLTCNVVFGAEVKHLLGFFDATNGAAANPQTACTIITLVPGVANNRLCSQEIILLPQKP